MMRVAFFSEETELRTMIPELTAPLKLRSAHYNLSPFEELPVLLNSRNDGLPELHRIPWGDKEEKEGRDAVILPEEAAEHLKRRVVQPATLLINGYFIWKKGRETEHPFFVRLLREPLLKVAAVLFRGNTPSASMILTESNPLIYPISETMPLLLGKESDVAWRAGECPTAEAVKRAGLEYQLTDFSVLRVSKKVNDPSNNGEKLIQPIPK